MRTQDQAAIEAVARHFSGAWEKGDDPADACLVLNGRRIAVAVTTIRRRAGEDGGPPKPQLRFDRVALGLVRRLQAALRDAVPDSRTVIVTVTAPIRLPGKTAAALEDTIRALLARRSVPVEMHDTIHGNRIRARLVEGGPGRTSNVIGFVHNPASDPVDLLNATQSLLECIAAAVRKQPPARFAGDRWLVLVDADGLSRVETYRHVCAQLSDPAAFQTILAVLGGGRVETLKG